MTLFTDFKKFLLRGNVIDLAVAVALGVAFSAVVAALVRDLLTPLIATIFGKHDFSSLTFTINGSTYRYGDFINYLISFVTVAAAMFFFVVLPVNRLMAHRAGGPGHQVLSRVHERDPDQSPAVSSMHRTAGRPIEGPQGISRRVRGDRRPQVGHGPPKPREPQPCGLSCPGVRRFQRQPPCPIARRAAAVK